MSHLRAHRLADLHSGKLGRKATARASEHLRTCLDCQRVLARITDASAGMSAIASQEAPELGWDHIGARIYWSTSSERRAKERKSRPPWLLPALGGVAASAMAAVAFWAYSGNVSQSRPATEPLATAPTQAGTTQVEPIKAPVPEALEPEAIRGLLTFAQGQVTADGAALDFQTPIAEGARFATAEGRAVIQFGEHSAFRVGTHSELQIRRFDSQRIELSVAGQVDVDITRRQPGQAFSVVAGGHEVVVQGTAFRVEFRDGELGVSCTRGKVVVTDGEDMVHVPAGQRFRVLSAAWKEAALRAAPIDSEALASLNQAMTMPMLGRWDENTLVSQDLAVVEVTAEANQKILVDGNFVSNGSFYLRAPSGRHEVAILEEDGEVGQSQWLELLPGTRGQAKVVAPRSSPKSQVGRSLRKKQLREQVEAGQRATRCLKPLAKQGLVVGSYVVFDLGINADGSQDYLNVVDSNLSPMIQRCLRDAVDSEQLPEGPSASFRLKLSY